MSRHKRLQQRIRNSPWRQFRQFRNREHRHSPDEVARYRLWGRLADRAFWPNGHRRPAAGKVAQ